MMSYLIYLSLLVAFFLGANRTDANCCPLAKFEECLKIKKDAPPNKMCSWTETGKLFSDCTLSLMDFCTYKEFKAGWESIRQEEELIRVNCKSKKN